MLTQPTLLSRSGAGQKQQQALRICYFDVLLSSTSTSTSGKYIMISINDKQGVILQ